MGLPLLSMPETARDVLLPLLRKQGIEVDSTEGQATFTCRRNGARIGMALTDVGVDDGFVVMLSTELKRFPWRFRRDTALLRTVIATCRTLGGAERGGRGA